MNIITFFSRKHKYIEESLVLDPDKSLREQFDERTKHYNENKNFWNILDDWINNIKYRISNIRTSIISFKDGMCNFWKYRKVIYRDRWWDYAFITHILQVKLSDMRDNWDKSIYLDSEKEKETLTRLCELLTQMEDDSDNEEVKNEFFDLLKENYFKLWD